MTSPNLHPTQRSAPDAHLDDLERELVVITTANLDEDDLGPAQVVDEFATEFLQKLSLPPDGGLPP